MTIKEAKRKAEESVKNEGLHISSTVLDDGEYFIFGYTEEIDISPVAVNKHTGEIEDYFPPDHPNFLKAKEIILD